MNTKNSNTKLLTVTPKKVRWVFELFNEGSLHPWYQNPVQNTLTGKSYEMTYKYSDEEKKNWFFKVYDVPDYISARPKVLPKGFRLKKIPQYQGFLVNVSGVTTVDEFLENQLSNRSRKRLKRSIKALQRSHSISHKIFFGHIEQKEHHLLFEVFAHFLKKRFNEKKTYNRYLTRWNFYETRSYEMINEGKASLFVMYCDEKPICITLNFHLEDVVFSELEGFDIAFSQYNLGDISMFQHILWCLDNDVKIIDLAMGKTLFKVKWSNHTYRFQHHLYYATYKIGALTQMLFESLKLNLWQLLRDLGIVGKTIRSDKLLFFLRKSINQQEN